MTAVNHRAPQTNPALLEVNDLVREYALPREHLFRPPGKVCALNGVSFSVAAGRSLGIVGESGSGKSTLARLVMALDAPTSGTVHLLGNNLHQLAPADLRYARRDFQMVFQDPYGSLDPRQTVERIVTEPL
ncbi:MAG: ATP-binding cassette domain-containing protein, partial [Burkholderiaceae bacterium]|nr:ATP-binding cassette domain-containing protein [Burkholderiaceae bacterium]